MSFRTWFASLAALCCLIAPSAISAQTATPVTHEELGRALDELAGQLHGLGERFRSHFGGGETPGEGPLVTLMLDHRHELGLSSAQVQALERIRAEFQREAAKIEADQRAARADLEALLRADPVDLDRAEARIREIERLRADLRIGRLRAIEQAKAQLTAEQRAKFSALAASPWPRWPRVGGPSAPPPPPAPPRRL